MKDTPNGDEIQFVFQMTRHGARSPYLFIDEPDVPTSEWIQGLGQLTPTGERQHYLIGAKHRNKLIDVYGLLSDTFDPQEIFIISTDVNRTIMSAYSEINSWYPMGTSVRDLTGDERDYAVPPFEVVDKSKILAKLRDAPTLSGFQPIPIHVSQEIDQMLRAMDAPVCPVVQSYESRATKEPNFAEVNARYTDNILKALEQEWGIDNLNFVTAKPYTDSFYAAFFDDRLREQYKLNITHIDRILADQFYEYTFYFDEMVRIASTKFLNFLHTTIDSKINSIATGEDDESGILKRKMIYLSAHDSTLAAMLSGIEQQQELQPFYASHILVELWRKDGRKGKDPEDYYVKWIYNGQSLNVTEECVDGKCPYPEFKEYLQSREYEGDWEKACNGGDIMNSYFGAWYIVVGAAGGILMLGTIGYFIIKRILLAPKD